MHVTMPAQHITDETSAIFKKSREGLYFAQGAQNELAQTWEALRHQCVIQKGPEIQGLSYHFERILGTRVRWIKYDQVDLRSSGSRRSVDLSH